MSSEIYRSTALAQWREQWKKEHTSQQAQLSEHVEIYWQHDKPDLVVLTDHDEGESITLLPQEALNLLHWLDAERAKIEQLAQEAHP